MIAAQSKKYLETVIPAIGLAIGTFLILVGVLVAVAHAQAPAPVPTPGGADLFKDLYEAVLNGHWSVVMGAVLLLIVWGFRKVVADDSPDPEGLYESFRAFVHTDLGGIVTSLVFGFGGAFGTALMAGKPIDFELVKMAFGITVGASGAFVWGKKVWSAIKAWRAKPKREAVPPPSGQADLRVLWVVFAVAVLGIVIANVRTAEAQVDTTNPKITYGSLTLAAATATAIPTTCTALRGAVAIQNLDTADIYCGGASVATTTGLKVVPGALINIEVSCNSARTAALVYCISTAGTAANGLRYIETK